MNEIVQIYELRRKSRKIPYFFGKIPGKIQANPVLEIPFGKQVSHLGHCWAKPAGAAPKGVIAPISRNGKSRY